MLPEDCGINRSKPQLGVDFDSSGENCSASMKVSVYLARKENNHFQVPCPFLFAVDICWPNQDVPPTFGACCLCCGFQLSSTLWSMLGLEAPDGWFMFSKFYSATLGRPCFYHRKNHIYLDIHMYVYANCMCIHAFVVT